MASGSVTGGRKPNLEEIDRPVARDTRAEIRRITMALVEYQAATLDFFRSRRRLSPSSALLVSRFAWDKSRGFIFFLGCLNKLSTNYFNNLNRRGSRPN